MPRLLFLCKGAPWKRNNGGLIRNYWLALAWSRRFEVDMLVVDTNAPPLDERFSSLGGEIIRLSPPSRFARARERLCSVFTHGSSFFTAGTYTRAHAHEIRARLASGRYTAVQFDLPFLHEVTPFRNMVFPIYNAHNCESRLLLRRIPYEPLWVRPLMHADAQRVRNLEREALACCKLALICSQNDRTDLHDITPRIGEVGVIVSNGVDPTTYAAAAAQEPERGTILITGSLDWRPNQVGVRWFCQNVLPALRSMPESSSLSIRIAGRMTKTFAAELAAFPEFTIIANPPDMCEELARARVIAIPVTASSGTRLRILEAWGAGRPVVTTNAGALGLTQEQGDHFITTDDSQTYARALATLAGNPTYDERIRQAARASASRYDWAKIGDTMLAAYDEKNR
jgi:polysaccharide biosynthesis protein PslH